MESVGAIDAVGVVDAVAPALGVVDKEGVDESVEACDGLALVVELWLWLGVWN